MNEYRNNNQFRVHDNNSLYGISCTSQSSHNKDSSLIHYYGEEKRVKEMYILQASTSQRIGVRDETSKMTSQVSDDTSGQQVSTW